MYRIVKRDYYLTKPTDHMMNKMRLSIMLLVPLIAIVIMTPSTMPPPNAACRYILPEDINMDGEVNINDAIAMATGFGSQPGDANWNPNADVVEDGQINILDAIRVSKKFGQNRSEISVVVNIHPESLNLKSQGRWITVYLAIPEGFNISHIVVSTIRINDTIPAETRTMNIENNTLIFKFSRIAVRTFISNVGKLEDKFTKVALEISGETDGAYFIAADMMTVILS